MRILTVITAAALALTSTIGMAHDAERRFTHGGEAYAYTSSESAGRQVIAGRRLSDNQRFRLVVRGDRVSGVVGTAPVAFRLAEARGAAGTVQVAAR